MRYARNVLFAMFMWLLMPMLVNLPRFVINGTLFPALCEWFPEVFTNYSPITQPDEYFILTATLDITVATLAVLVFSYIAVRYDNERMEYMISRTEGMYSLKEGCALYYPRYIYADLAVSIIVPIPLLVASAFVPAHIHDLVDPIFDYLFAFGRIYTELFGYVLGGIVMSVSIFATRLLSGLKSLGAWQGIWLSEIG